MDYGKFVEEKVKEIKSSVGNKVAVSALSGGVDSSAVTLLGHKALGKQLRAIFIDDGLMREKEPEQVKETFSKLGIELIELEVLNKADDFFKLLKGITDAEEKRKVFRNTFYKTLGEIVRTSGANFLLQGTIAADVVETKKGVKTQHNILEQIGIDPKKEFGFQVIEPIKELYKDQVRELAKVLGLPELIYQRMPFPGPGLATRVVGEVTKERVEIVRKACRIVEEETSSFKPFQAFAVLLNDKATGLGSGGERNFGQIIAVRSVESTNAMQAEITQLPWEVLVRIQKRIVQELPQVVKVVYDLTPKPPSTIEYI
ncbi:MAG TPA: glutamine-hydrolyzing GMP synthase subunit GuaA [Elusimicrobia bacterium]|jgi:GMP synthase (glutamine-hydrolysing)|nr:glutamine-hydrolyzing GMP synthase subunit GuaA [Elusimicrobiota bacterium]